MRGFQMHFFVGPAASRGAEGPVIEFLSETAERAGALAEAIWSDFTTDDPAIAYCLIDVEAHHVVHIGGDKERLARIRSAQNSSTRMRQSTKAGTLWSVIPLPSMISKLLAWPSPVDGALADWTAWSRERSNMIAGL